MAFNKVILMGRLTSDPELKVTQSGTSVTSFGIAVNRKVKQGNNQEADFFNVTAWRSTAEFVSRYFRKGSSICIVGTLQNNSWTDQNGQKRTATDIIADEVQFVDSKNNAQSAGTASPMPYVPDAYRTDAEPKYEPVSADDDLPF